MAPLPPKQNGIFKKILKCYDYKQYKMGLKLAKQILSNPETANHGETLAMKGLILNCMGKKEEAYEYVKKGLRNDLTSHVCWHVYGLLQRSEHKYDEAIKCYRNALKYDEDNLTILRDLSLLQIQMRDLEGFRDTRYQLFMLRSAQRVSWLSFAAAYHLLKDYNTAAKILDEFRLTQKQQKEQNNSVDDAESKKTSHPEPIDYEQSELLLYQVMILHEAQNYKEALDFLNKHSSQICDRLSVLEYKAQLLLALGRNQEAVRLLNEQLIARNQENYLYYQQLEQALNLKPQDEDNRLRLYQDIQQKYPRSQVPFKLPLVFVNTPEKFKPIADAYMRKYIRKCLPALFKNMRPTYNKEIPAKIRIVEELALSYEKNLQEINSFDSDPSTKNSENKTIILWVYYFLAQHYDYLGQHDKALEYVRIATEHTPTLIELLTLKGKIYKHMGQFEKAVEQMNEAQRLDTADRYLNSKCAKYLLRANKVAQAQEMCSKFTRAGVSVTENLIEMQCMWFMIESAQAYNRMKLYGQALKKCYEIDAYFSEVTEDQFDFHTYCMRKMTLRSYIKLLRLEDVLRSHRFYFQAAELAINIYLKLHDEPLSENQENLDSTNANNQLSASELKKIKNKERKAAAKQQQNQKHSNTKVASHDGDSERQSNKAKHKGNQTQNNTKQNNAVDSATDQNDTSGLDPCTLEHPKDPLEKAIRFLRPLMTLATGKIETHLLAFEVYRRKDKILLMLKSVKRASKLNPHHQKFKDQFAEFLKIVDSRRADGKLGGPIGKVLDIELNSLTATLSP